MIKKPFKQFLTSNFFIALFMAVMCMGFTYCVLGFYFVEYEALFNSFYSGKLTPGFPFRSIYFLGNVGISYAYSFLYQFFPQIEWLSWFYATYLLIASVLFNYLLLFFIPKSVKASYTAVLLVFLYFLIIADNNIHFIYTRVSYIVSASALISLIVFFSDPDAIQKRKYFFVFLNFFFVLGLLTRVESTLVVVAFSFIFGLVYLRELKKLFVVLGFPVLMVMGVSISIVYIIKTSNEYHIQVEPEIEAQFCERNNVLPLSAMKTNRDSIIYITARDIVWSDSKVITPQYLRSLILKKSNYWLDPIQWHRAWYELLSISYKYWYFVVWQLFLFTLILDKYHNSRDRLYLIIFSSSFWLLSLFQAYSVKINDRSFAPLFAIFIFCHTLLFLKNCAVTLRITRITFIFLFVTRLYFLINETQILKQEYNRYYAASTKIRNFAKGKILALNSSSCDYLFLSNRPFYVFDYSAFKRIYITDGFNIPFLPYYKPYLEKECGCKMNEFPSFWQYLKSQNSQVIVISTKSRINILQDYIKELYHIDLMLKMNMSVEFTSQQRSDNREIWNEIKAFSFEE